MFLIIYIASVLLTIFIWRMYVKCLGITDNIGVIIFLAFITFVPIANLLVSMMIFMMEFDLRGSRMKFDGEKIIERFHKVTKKILFIREKK